METPGQVKFQMTVPENLDRETRNRARQERLQDPAKREMGAESDSGIGVRGFFAIVSLPFEFEIKT